MTIIYGQYNDATLTKLVLKPTYAGDCDNGNIIKFLDRIKLICYESKGRGSSHKPYKIAFAVKLLHNCTKPKPDDPHRIKAEVKVKYNAPLAIVGKFPNRQH